MNENELIKQKLLDKENAKRRARFSSAAVLAGMAGAGLGSYYKKKLPLYAALGVAASGGYHAAKNKAQAKKIDSDIKKHFGINEEKLFNPKAIMPSQEKVAAAAMMHKEAILGSIIHALAETFTPDMYHNLPHMIQAYAPAVIDYASIPAIGIAAKNQLQNVSQLAAKNSLKMPMTSGETIRFGLAKKLKDVHDSAHNAKGKLLGPVARYFSGYAAAPAAGISVGEGMAKGLKWLPQGLREKIVDAIRSEGAQDALLGGVNEVKRIAGDVGLVGGAGALGYLAAKATPDDKKKTPIS